MKLWVHHSMFIVWFQKISILIPGRSMEIPRGRGSQQPKFIRESMKQLEIPGGREGSNKRELPWGQYGYFLEPRIIVSIIKIMYP